LRPRRVDGWGVRQVSNISGGLREQLVFLVTLGDEPPVAVLSVGSTDRRLVNESEPVSPDNIAGVGEALGEVPVLVGACLLGGDDDLEGWPRVGQTRVGGAPSELADQ
jgi:hypothetical protein